MTRPSSEVDSVHPDDTTGEGPPITDTDKDTIPALQEQMYSTPRNITLDETVYTINGLDFETKSECINLLKDGCFKEGYKVIIVSHDNNAPTLLGANRVKLENILR